MAMTVYDENGRKYSITTKNKLGEGGQGAVYRVSNDKRIAIKTCVSPSKKAVTDENDNETILADEEYYDRYSKKIRHIMAIDAITSVDNIATPVAMLRRPYCGYVMRFMNDMENISNQMRRTRENIIPMVNGNTSLAKKYMVLSKIAGIIEEMNGKGLVYCDLSPGNVFISKAYDSHEVWLIDTDNIHFSGRSAVAIGTPRYRAPELVNGTQSTNTFYSDIYSFALLAYEYLTLSTPFWGEMSQENLEDDWDCENAENDSTDDFDIKAERGEIPYVYEDKGNNPIEESGIAHEYVFTKEIELLFLRTFCEAGRKQPESRPSAGEWHEALERALNSIGVCSNNHTHIGTACAWCGYENLINPNRVARDQNVYFSIISEDYIASYNSDEWDKTEAPKVWPYSDYCKLISHNKLRPTHYELPGCLFSNNPNVTAKIEIKSNTVNIWISGKNISPSAITWKYKAEPGVKVVDIKEDGILKKRIQLYQEN